MLVTEETCCKGPLSTLFAKTLRAKELVSVRCISFDTWIVEGILVKFLCVRRSKTILVVLVVAAVITGIIAAVLLLIRGDDDDGTLRKYENAAISANAPECANIARNTLQQNGTVGDAAIAALLCMGVMHGQSMGIGGGFFMVYYSRAERKTYVLNARDVAPAKATENIFEVNDTSSKGSLAVAVPGELTGYWEIYKKIGGGVKWETLFQPTIKLCEDGFKVDAHTANALDVRRDIILTEPAMAEIFRDPKTQDVYKLGDIITRPVLAQTLRKIANDSVNGGNLLYQRESQLAQWFVEDLQKLGGIMTIKDLENYQAKWLEPIEEPVAGGFTIHTIPPPGSGALLTFILRILNKYKLNSRSITAGNIGITTLHLIVEAFKHAYAKRTILGDPFDEEIASVVHELVHNLTQSSEYLESVHSKIKLDSTSNNWKDYGAEFYMPDDHGTSHVSIIGPNGDAISVTSTVNLYFGAMIRSNRTGIIYNDEMGDFSYRNITSHFGIPPSPNNFIKPGKTPLSSMSGAIFTDSDGNVRLAIGAAGGTSITTSTAYVAIRNLWFNENIKEAIDAPRIHHQLAPMELVYEEGLQDDWVKGLAKIGHNMTLIPLASSRVMGVARSADGVLWANCDFRVSCSIDGF
ncbi:unnamed protein product [Allacma fusca]|uniref:Gamma-glutamyltranspeptidase 1 n=1 Tax=Allacma fusca TaxID=39272 RepID=A0A8J2JIJ4_9HEXA|nr:unnamed protein product [Allacma fusca]